jgi:hypothetical protein
MKRIQILKVSVLFFLAMSLWCGTGLAEPNAAVKFLIDERCSLFDAGILITS